LTGGRRGPNLPPPRNAGPPFTPTRAPEPQDMSAQQRIHVMSESDVRRAVARMARQIVEQNGGTQGLVLMGIHRRGVQIAALLQAEIEKAENVELPVGSIDITLYRDDLEVIGPRPVVGGSDLPSEGVDDRCVVLVDDVAYTGRTTKAALNELGDWGRPRRILLCVLVDRGGRELPIQPDITGREVQVLPGQRVEVLVPEYDGRLAVDIVQGTGDEA
jgi:pyrimidine operon attenuation protein/uracil phosphoribosyltransferase